MPTRAFPRYAAIAGLTAAAGLASRRYPEVLPGVVARYAGDTLWAAMVFWLLALLWPRARTRALAIGALAISVVVECGQLWHATWLEALRETRLGALALGQGFLWSDLVCYAIGVAIAAGLDPYLVNRARAPDPPATGA